MGKFVSFSKSKFLFIIDLLIITLFLLTNSTFAEDIVLTGNQVMVIENTAYTQTGNIFVRESAKLIIKNSTLIFNQRYHEEFRVVVEGNAAFEVRDSITETGILQHENVEISVLNQANIIFEGVNWINGYLELMGSGVATVSNSKLAHLWIMFTPSGGANISASNLELATLTFRFGNNFQGEFSDLKPGLSSYWSYNLGNYDIKFENVTYRNIDFQQDSPSQITVSKCEFAALGCRGNPLITLKVIDSIIDHFALHGFDNTDHCTIQLENLKKGFYSYWSLRDHASGDCIPNVVFENSTITNGWLVSSFGDTLTIISSDLSRLGSMSYTWPTDLSHSPTDITSVYNSKIDELMLYYSSAALIFDNTSIHFINAYLPSNSIIRGNITFDKDAFIYNWVNSIITRNYPVDLKDQNGKFSSGATLYLYSNSGNLVWSGATDENGKVDFDIVFDNNNYLDTWKLEVNYYGRKFYKDITLLTSTPITIPIYNLWISSTAGGTTNPPPGTYTYDEGTEAVISAIPDINYRFSKWTGDVPSEDENDNPITITIDSDKSIEANFIRQYTLTIASGAGGTTDPLPGSYIHDSGTQATIKAIPNSGYRFSDWGGDISGTTNPITITMDSNKSITANFIRQYTLTITSGTGGTTDPSLGTYTYDSGTEVSVSATPDKGYEFSGWSGDASGTNNPIKITMNSDKSITANFKQKPFLDRCFIATAAYGSPLHSSVRTLQDFRDRYLIRNKVGRALVRFYYRHSPPVAGLIARHRALKIAVQAVLLPLVVFSYFMLRFGPVITAVIFSLMFAFSVFLVRFYRKRARRAQIKIRKQMRTCDSYL